MALSAREVIRNSSRKETKPHGTPGFPCAGYGYSMTGRPDDITPWHWHEELEVVFITEGIMDLGIIGRHILLHEGEMAVINSNILHSARAERFCTLRSMVFSSKLITGGNDAAIAVKYILPLIRCQRFNCILLLPSGCSGQEPDVNCITGNECKDCIRLFSDAHDLLRQDMPGYELAVREALGHVLWAVFRYYESAITEEERAEQRPDNDAVRISRMLEFIHTHFAEPMTLNEISQAADIGEREALRCFRRTIGEPPMHYLTRYRLMQSTDMLKNNPTQAIAVTAGECGFDSPSYYAKKFRELYCCTPREYIRSSAEMRDNAVNSVNVRTEWSSEKDMGQK